MTDDIDTAIVEAIAARGRMTGSELFRDLSAWPRGDVIARSLALAARGQIVPRDGAFTIRRAA